MSDARWSDIDADTSAAVNHFSLAIRIYCGVDLRDDTLDGYTRRMAFMHAMHAGHTSMEKVLLRILEIQGEDAERPPMAFRPDPPGRAGHLGPAGHPPAGPGACRRPDPQVQAFCRARLRHVRSG